MIMASHPHFLWRDLFRRGNERKRTVIDTLRENILFCTLNRRELNYLSNFVYERTYQVNEPVFQQNERGIGMYIIAKGQIAIKTQSPQGEVLVTTLHEGSFFGEIALVDPDIRSASAVPIEKSVVVSFFKPDLEEILQRKPDMGVKILFQLCTVLGHRLAETTDRITSMARFRPSKLTAAAKVQEDAA
jgi:CRP-like cAMP-binding protein